MAESPVIRSAVQAFDSEAAVGLGLDGNWFVLKKGKTVVARNILSMFYSVNRLGFQCPFEVVFREKFPGKLDWKLDIGCVQVIDRRPDADQPGDTAKRDYYTTDRIQTSEEVDQQASHVIPSREAIKKYIEGIIAINIKDVKIWETVDKKPCTNLAQSLCRSALDVAKIQ